MEDKLKQSQENYYQTIFENTGAANIIVEENKLISLVNTEFSSLTGYSKEETEGKMEWTQVFHQDDRERMEDYHRLRRINPNHAPRNYEAKLIGKDNSVKYVYLTVAMIPDTQKSMISVLDMTELQKSKRAIEESREEV